MENNLVKAETTANGKKEKSMLFFIVEELKEHLNTLNNNVERIHYRSNLLKRFPEKELEPLKHENIEPDCVFDELRKISAELKMQNMFLTKISNHLEDVI